MENMILPREHISSNKTTRFVVERSGLDGLLREGSRMRTSLARFAIVAIPLLCGRISNAMPSVPLPSPEQAVARTGAAVVEIPIPVPPGTAGFEPEIRLRYSSQAGDGPFGVGWSLNLGEIRRSTRFGMPLLADGEEGAFELDGRLLVLSDTAAGYRRFHSMVADFHRILAFPGSGAIDYWVVTSPTGITSRYGFTDDSQVGTARWLLSEISDPNGNTIRFTYATFLPGNPPVPSNNPVPAKVEYTYRGGSPHGPLREVSFLYENRPDTVEQFSAGIRTVLTQRVKKIEVKVNGTLQRELALGYADEGYYTERSRLASVEVCAGACSLDQKLPPATYVLEDPQDALSGDFWQVPSPSNRYVLEFPIEEKKGGDNSRDLGWRVGDVNGDGLPDLVRAYLDDSQSPTPVYDVRLNTGDGFAPDPTWTAQLAAVQFNNPLIRIDKNGNGSISGVVQQYHPSGMYFAERRDWQDGWLGDNSFFVAPVNARFVDVNGDRRADVVASFLTGGAKINCPAPCTDIEPTHVAEVWLNNGDGWAREPNLSQPLNAVTGEGIPPLEALFLRENSQGGVDFPGDSKCVAHAGGGACTAKVGWFPAGAQMADVSGDGHLDILISRCGGADCLPEAAALPAGTWLGGDLTEKFRRNLGLEPPVTHISIWAPDGNFVDTGVRYVDLNGDGLADVVKTRTDGALRHQAEFEEEKVYLSTGSSWCGPQACDTNRYRPPEPFFLFPGLSAFLFFADVNADGLVDLVRADEREDAGRRTWLQDRSDPGALNTVWKPDSSNLFKPDAAVALAGSEQKNFAEGLRTRGVVVADFDGNGTIDFLKGYDSNDGGGVSLNEETRLSSRIFSDRLVSASNGEGGQLEFEHVSLVEQRDAGLEGLIEEQAWIPYDETELGLDLLRPHDSYWPSTPVVAAATFSASQGPAPSSFALQYGYAGSRWDRLWRSPHGPRLFHVVRPGDHSTWTYFHHRRGIGGQRAVLEVGTGQGAERAVDHEVVRSWEVLRDATIEGSAGWYVGRLGSETRHNLYAGVPGAELDVEYGYVGPSCGFNLPCTIQISRPTGNASIERRYRSIGEDSTGDPWIRGLVEIETVRNEAGEMVRHRTQTFDGAGNLRTRSRTVKLGEQVEDPINEVWTYDVDGVGLLKRYDDPRQKQTHFTWDPAGSVLAEVQDPLGGMHRFTERHVMTGAPVEFERELVQDQVEVTNLVRDAFGRIREVKVTPAGGGETLLEERFPTDGLATAVEFITHTGVSDPIRDFVYFDGLGRRMREVREGNWSSWVGTARAFDYAGRVVAETLPTSCAADATCATLAPTGPLAVALTYDSLGRLVSRAMPSGTEMVQYGAAARLTPRTSPPYLATSWDTATVVDARNSATRYWTDGERVGWVDECHGSGPGCSSSEQTAYAYEPTGEIAAIFDSTQAWNDPNHYVKLTYDTAGRQRGIEDPNAGTRHFEYDPAGNLSAERNARNQVTGYGYDDLDRLASIDYADLPDVTIYYDPLTRERSSVTQGNPNDAGYELGYEYDPLGRVEQERLRTRGIQLVANYDLDLLGRPTRIEYPDNGTTVIYTYDGPRLLKVCRPNPDSSCKQQLLVNTDYDTLGRAERLQYLVGEIRRGFYESGPQVRRLERTTFRFNEQGTYGPPTLQLRYSYDSVGNLLGVTDEAPSNGVDFSSIYYGYDHRDRLGAWASFLGVRNFDYDAFGNLERRETVSGDVYDFTFEPTRPHRVESVSIYQAATQSTLGPFDYKYDPDGNLIVQPGAGATRLLTYDSQSRLVTVQAGGQAATHQYDLDGRRIATVSGSQTTIYFGDLFEYAPDPNPTLPDETKGTSFVFAFGERFVSRRVTAPTLRTGATPPLGIPLPEVPPWTLAILLLGGTGWLAIRFQVPRALRARPAYGTLSLVLCVSLVALPAGGGGDPPSVVTRWYISDPLGSTSLVLAVDGEVSRRQLDPYGEVANQSSSELTHRLFTGQRVDPTTGLADFRARWYDPASARFLSADPLIADAFDPQQHNAFAFVRGNPLRYTDPTGMTGIEGGGCIASPLLCIGLIGLTIANLFGDEPEVVEEIPPFLGPAGPPGAGLEISINLEFPNTNTEDLDSSYPGQSGPTPEMEKWDPGNGEYMPFEPYDLIGLLALARALFTRALGTLAREGVEVTAREATEAAAREAGEVGIIGARSVGAAARAARVLQSGGRTVSRRTADALNEYAGTNLSRREIGRALESLKRAEGVPNNVHGQILDNGDLLDDAGNLVGNLIDYFP
jgi:RHS repeat-associated protein